MLEFMNITKALADENRVRIILGLHLKKELCACQLTDLLALSPSTVSKHLFLLKNARLIVGRKDGRWMHYRLNQGSEAPAAVTGALDWIIASVRDETVIAADRERIEEIVQVPIETRCGK